MPCCVAKTEKVKSWQLHQALKLLAWVAVALPLIELWQPSLVPRPSPSFCCLQYSSGDLSHLTIPQVTGSWVRAWNRTNDNHYVCWVRLQGAWCSVAYAKVYHCLWHYKLLMHAAVNKPCVSLLWVTLEPRPHPWQEKSPFLQCVGRYKASFGTGLRWYNPISRVYTLADIHTDWKLNYKTTLTLLS